MKGNGQEPSKSTIRRFNKGDQPNRKGQNEHVPSQNRKFSPLLQITNFLKVNTKQAELYSFIKSHLTGKLIMRRR